MTHDLRPLQWSDRDQLAAVYHDAVISQAARLYSPAQIAAWSNPDHILTVVEQALSHGYGLASCTTTAADGAAAATDPIEAFGVLDPIWRLSLLYCRGRACRQGRASAILRALEEQARQQGCQHLHTEASQLSRPLLMRRGWQIETEESVIFAGEHFQRWRMIRTFNPSP